MITNPQSTAAVHAVSPPLGMDARSWSEGANDVTQPLRDLLRGLKLKRKWITRTTSLLLLAAIAFLLIAPTRYMATAELLLDPREKRMIDGAVVSAGLGTSATGADGVLVDSQIELITSPSLIRRVVERFSLERDSEFNTIVGPGIRVYVRNALSAFIPGLTPEIVPEANRVEAAVNKLLSKRLRVQRTGNTYILQVSVLSKDPDKAARLANAISETYLAAQSEELTAATRAATAALQSRMDELRERVRTAERNVESYRANNGLIGGPGLLVDEQQLQSMNEKLTAARAETSRAKAISDQLQTSSIDSIAAGSTPAALNYAVVANLRAAYGAAKRREDSLAQMLGNGHPEMIRARTERQSVARLIEDELRRVRASAENEYKLALDNENSLGAQLKSLEKRMMTNNDASVTLRELQREADAAKSVLETFLVRTKETQVQDTLNWSNSRVVSPAVAPTVPAFPSTIPVLSAALGGGLMLGTLMAWIAYVLSGGSALMVAAPAVTAAGNSRLNPARSAGEIETLATLQEVGGANQFWQKLFAPQSGHDRPRGDAVGQAILDTIKSSGVDERQFTRSALQLHARLQGFGGEQSRVVMLASSSDGVAGTTSVAMALALAGVLARERVLLVDAGIESSQSPKSGVTNLKSQRVQAQNVDAALVQSVVRDPHSNVDILPLSAVGAWRPGSTGWLQVAAGLRGIAPNYDLVVIAAGAGGREPGGVGLAACADQLLVIAELKNARSRSVNDMVQALAKGEATVTGLVFTKAA